MSKKKSKLTPVWYIVIPAAAIQVGQFSQTLLTKFWYGSNDLHIGNVNVTSYISIMITGILCLFVGSWLKKRSHKQWQIILIIIPPVLWLLLMTSAIIQYRTTTLINAVTVTIFLSGLFPLIAVLLGWYFVPVKKG
ncbi:MAG TPA: hypothetical protein VJ991_14460 [Balneolales bacterium]|nr:hypothetical protein [Balneolales bacterium]